MALLVKMENLTLRRWKENLALTRLMDLNDSLESGEENYFPALNVGSDKLSTMKIVLRSNTKVNKGRGSTNYSYTSDRKEDQPSGITIFGDDENQNASTSNGSTSDAPKSPSKDDHKFFRHKCPNTRKLRPVALGNTRT